MSERRPPIAGRGDGGQEESNKDTIRLVVVLVFLVLFIAFVVDNSNSVPVGFVFFGADAPLIWVLVVTFVLGALVGSALSARSRRKRRDRAR